MRFLGQALLGLALSFSMHTGVLADDTPIFDDNRSEVTLKFGGWSKHFSERNDIAKKYDLDILDFNESHYGLGLEYATPLYDTNHYLMTGAWYMKDSFSNDAFHLGLGYKYRIDTNFTYLSSVDINIVATYMNRTAVKYNLFLTIADYYHAGLLQKREYITTHTKEVYRTNLFLPIPYLTFNITESFNIDVTLLPMPGDMHVQEEQYAKPVKLDYLDTVLFIKAGITF